MQEDASNSQRDNITVVSVENEGDQRVRVNLSDGSLFLLPRKLFQERSIETGISLSVDELQRLEGEAQRIEAEQKALQLLARGPHTKEGLRLKLSKRRHSPQAIQHSLMRMEELGYLDDVEFAELWLQTRIRRHPESRVALRAGLRKRGIGRELAEATVDRLFTEEVERDCARRVLEKLRAVRDDPPSKLARKLLARGFSPPIVHEFFEPMQ